MKFTEMSLSLLSLAAAVLIRPVSAGLIPDLLQSLENLQNINKRCDNPCGYYGQLCCQSNEYCYTDTAGQAQCGANAATSAVAAQTGGSWQYYTTTYVQTDLKTVTQTYSSFVAVATSSTCNYAQGQTPCGSVCCNSGQYCQTSGSCVAVPGSSGYYSSLYTVTTVVTNTASAPLRPTTNTVTTLTSTRSATTTAPFQTPVGTDGAILTGATSSSGGLSGGAIAGIVIGVIFGILLLLLLCACCCFKGLLDSLLAIFGLGGRRRREETTYVEERRSHRTGGGVRTWFGSRPAKTEVIEEKKSGWGTGASVAAFLGGLALLLGLKRKRDRDNKSSSGYGSEYYSDYYSNTSSSSSSSGRRTRTNRSRSRSRASRGTRL